MHLVVIILVSPPMSADHGVDIITEAFGDTNGLIQFVLAYEGESDLVPVFSIKPPHFSAKYQF
jgi:hypothetical protein